MTKDVGVVSQLWEVFRKNTGKKGKVVDTDLSLCLLPLLPGTGKETPLQTGTSLINMSLKKGNFQ